jgi:O-acetyl-ADP-ribose deacetylase (regulator of RNase III)
MPYSCIVKQGNLLDEEDATFIVNASNTTMMLGSGVSDAFRKKCGAILQHEMIEKLRSLGHALQKGDVIATSPGKATHFKYALHAAIMDYNQGVRYIDKMPTVKDICRSLENIALYLQWYADTHPGELVKLVLPLMGTGVGGLDAREVLECYRDYFQKEVPFECQVIVYTHSERAFQTAREICLG